MFKNSGLYNPVRNPVGVKNRMWYLLRWRKEILLQKKKRETSKFTITLDFKLESHREGSALISEYLRDYMKNGLMKTSPTDLIMTSTKMD
jgi:penicillin-binding protein 1A